MTDTTMNMDSEAAANWPTGIAIEGFDLSNNVMVDDPLLMGHSFDWVDRQVQKCTSSHPPSIGVGDSISNNNGSFVNFGKALDVTNLHSLELRESISNNDGNCVEVGTIICKPYVGMEFDTIEASHAFWERYAHDTGFRARIRATSRRKRDGVIRTRTYVCAKEGKRGVDPRRTPSKRRPETRCNCGATMLVSLVKGTRIYRVITFVEEHNHGLDGRWNTPRITHEVDPTNNSTNVPSVCKPIVGMEFDNVEASGAFWEQYAHDVGFGARIRSTSKRKNDGVIRTRTYVCSREGTKYIDPRNLNSKPRSDTRCGCGAHMTVSLVRENGKYRVVTFVEEHNHELDDRHSLPRPKAPAQRVGKFQQRDPISSLQNEAHARDSIARNDVVPTAVEGPLLNLTNAHRMGILCTEFMQLAYRAVVSNEVFEGVRSLIKDGHSLADKY